MATAQRVVQLAEATNDPMLTATALQHVIEGATLVGDDEVADVTLERLRELEQSLRIPSMTNSVAMLDVGVAMRRGDFDALERHAEVLLQLGLTTFPSALAVYGGALFELRWAQGRLDEVAPMFVSAIEDLPSYSGYRPALVTVYCETGQLDGAREVFARDADNDFELFPFDSVWLACMILYAESAVALDDTRAAEVLHERLLPFADLFGATGPIYYGMTRRVVGRLAHFLGRSDEAEQHLRTALRVHRERRATYWVARNALDVAEVLVVQPEGHAEALTLIEEATDLATAGGFGTELRRAQSLA
jgi:tetratricopeptide (TPR) repeat protein